MAILGDAAGTSARQLGHYFPQTRVDAVELDGKLTQVGRELFDLRGPHLHTYTADARPWLNATPRRYDVILVDAYRQPYIPFYLTTQEFFALVRDRLAPGGLVVVNVGHPEGSTSLEKVLGATMRAAFGYGAVWRDPSQRVNTMLVGTTSGDPAGRLRAVREVGPGRPRSAGVHRRRPARPRPAGRPGVHRRPGPGRVADRPEPGRAGEVRRRALRSGGRRQASSSRRSVKAAR